MNIADDTIPRPPGCVCTWEPGDSDCPVHALCPECGASQETTRLFKARAEGLAKLNTARANIAALGADVDWLRAEIDRMRPVIEAALLLMEPIQMDYSLASARRSMLSAAVAAYRKAKP